MSADQQPQRRFDVVALVAGLVFLLFSVVSLTVGVLDLPRFGAVPLWVVLIGAGVLLLVSELRSRKKDQTADTPSAGSSEQAAWEQDPYR